MIFAFGVFEFDTDAYELRRDGTRVHMEPQVFDVLRYLLEQRDRVVPKEELLDNVWGNRFVSESALTSRIKAVRKAVGDDGQAQGVIRTVHGRGYRFVAAVGERSVADTGVPATSPADPPGAVRLGERAASRRQLLAAVEEAVAGRGVVAIVCGEAGIGKTTMVRDVIASAGGRVRVLSGVCDDLITAQPWGPLYDMARSAPEGPLAAALAGSEPRHAVLRAVYDEVTQSDRPTIVVVEDVHWADEATIDAMTYLARRIDTARALLLLTYRDEEVDDDHPLRRLVGGLAGPLLRNIELQPLGLVGVRELTGVDEPTAGSLLRLTGGNPFFLQEVTPSGGTETTATLRGAVLARLARLSPAGQHAVRTLSVIPGRIERRLAEAMVSGAVAALAEAEHRGFLVGDASAVWFRHELARSAVEGSLPASRLVAVNRLAMSCLVQEGVRPARIVHHATAANDPDAVANFGLRAAREAAAAGGHREAVAHYERVLEHLGRLNDGERGALHRELAHELYLVNRMTDAADHASRAVQVFERIHDIERLGEALMTLSRIDYFLGRVADAESAARRSVELMEEGRELSVLALARSNLASLLALSGRTEEAVVEGTSALELARDVGAREAEVHALLYLGLALTDSDPEAALRHLEEGAALAEEIGHREYTARANYNIAVILYLTGRFHQSRPWLERCLASADEFELVGGTYTVETGLEHLRLFHGAWREAEAGLRELLNREHVEPIYGPRSSGAVRLRYYPLVVLARLLARRGDPEAADLLAEARELVAGTDRSDTTGLLAVAQLEWAWLHGDINRVRSEVEAAIKVVAADGHRQYHGELLRYLARAGESIENFDGCPDQYAAGIAGDWERAANLWAALGNPYERALELAESRREDLVDEALAILDELGAEATAALIRRGGLGDAAASPSRRSD